MAEPVAITALALDAAFGWPTALYKRIKHPVALFAWLINFLARQWNREEQSRRKRRLGGIATVIILVVVAGSSTLAIEAGIVRLAGPYAWPLIALLAWPALAQRSLYDHVHLVATALDKDNLTDAHQAVSMIVGRDTDNLNEAGVARAAIESLSENFCDAVAAPLFWLLVAGLPGIWVYKAINTADSLIGHKDAQWGYFGWAAARTDDLLNLVPARVAGIILCIAGAGGWQVMWRDARKHASPNAGWTEAAMAGALGIRLAGPVSYDGVPHAHDWIGDGQTEAKAQDINRALRIYIRACLMLWIIAGGWVWAP